MIETKANLRCDNCGHLFLPQGENFTAVALRTMARQQGWTKNDENEDLCEGCRPKKKEPKSTYKKPNLQPKEYY